MTQFIESIFALGKTKEIIEMEVNFIDKGSDILSQVNKYL